MVVELAAVRLLAPWFGTSLMVWTNVIAVILLGLAIGYLFGGRLAARPRPLAALGWTLVAAGALVAWMPAAGGAIARGLLPEEIELHEAAELISWGSLAVSLFVFLTPAALLGTVCPLASESLARAQQSSAGRAGGIVLCVSTLGSLLGVFGTSHVLLPTLGLWRTFQLAGSVLFLLGLLAHGLARRGGGQGRVGTGALVGLLLGASFVSSPARPGLPSGCVELTRVESPYQSLRVVEDRRQEPILRFLRVNEGFDSFQSVWQAQPGLLPPGFYYNDFLLPFSWVQPAGEWHVLVLGLGAGSTLRVFEGRPEVRCSFVGVEIDPAVVDLGRAYFDLSDAGGRHRLWGGLDARVALRVARGPFDQIVLDCYANQIEIPPHLCTLEFFRELRERLAPGGWMTANLGGFDFEDPVVSTVARTCARAFDSPVLLVRVPESRNFVLIGRRDAPLPWSGSGLSPATSASSIDLGARRLPGFARTIEPGASGALLSDDLCPIELLQVQSIEQAIERRLAASGS